MQLDGAQNIRDLGGYRTAHGREVARGVVFRGDALSRLTRADMTTISDLRLRTVVDFRLPGEVLVNGQDRLPDGATLISLPMPGADVGTFYDLIAGGDHRQQQAVLGQGRASQFMLDLHRGFVTDQRQRDGFGIALRMMADGERGLPLLYHCTSGKERTGWMTAIVLTALGVPHATVVADYLLSNDIYQARYFKLGNDLAKTGMMGDPGLLRPIMELNPAYLEAAFDEVGHCYGTFNEFMYRGLGMDEQAMARLLGGLLTSVLPGRGHLRRPGLRRFSRHQANRMNTTDSTTMPPMSVSQVLDWWSQPAGREKPVSPPFSPKHHWNGPF